MGKKRFKNLVLGAGPSGLSAAYYLMKSENGSTLVLEADKQVGGLSKTVKYNNHFFDIGGHRFFTKSQEVLSFWDEILGQRFLSVKRESKIYYKGSFLSYPLKASECFFKISPLEGFKFFASFFLESFKKKKEPKNYEEWMIQSFGRALYNAFFKSYTEKVWGMKCENISSSWAAQRINKLNLYEAIKNSFGSKSTSKSLIDNFMYPEFGPGQFWEACSDRVLSLGGEVLLDNRVIKISQKDGLWLVETNTGQYEGERIFYSLPLGLLPLLAPTLLNEETSKNTKKLCYRHFVTVAVMGKELTKVKTQWIYIQEEKLKVGRIQNYKYWSKSMVPEDEGLCVGLEYFCSDNDELWNLNDEEWIELAKKELDELKLFGPVDKWFKDAKVVRAPYAYPIYDQHYEKVIDSITKDVEQIEGFYPIGRNGMHRYNNQDHAIMTAFLSVQNLKTDSFKNPWNINQDAEYIEA